MPAGQTVLPGRDAPPKTSAVLEVHALTKRFGDRVAVDGLDLAIVPGEIYCLVGPNGAGKTTINLFLNFVEPTSGVVMIRPRLGFALPWAERNRLLVHGSGERGEWILCPAEHIVANGSGVVLIEPLFREHAFASEDPLRPPFVLARIRYAPLADDVRANTRRRRRVPRTGSCAPSAAVTAERDREAPAADARAPVPARHQRL